MNNKNDLLKIDWRVSTNPWNLIGILKKKMEAVDTLIEKWEGYRDNICDDCENYENSYDEGRCDTINEFTTELKEALNGEED